MQEINDDFEIIQAQKVLDAARERKLQAQREAYEAAQTALAAQKAREEEKQTAAREQERAAEKLWQEKKAAEQEKKKQAQAAERAEQIRLEGEFNKQSEIKRQQESHEAQLAKLQEATLAEDQEAQSLRGEAARHQLAVQNEREAAAPPKSTGPAQQTDGLEAPASILEGAPWGTPALRNIFNRSYETSTQPSAVAETSTPPAESEFKRQLIAEFGLAAVQDAEMFVLDSMVSKPGVSTISEVENVLRSRFRQ